MRKFVLSMVVAMFAMTAVVKADTIQLNLSSWAGTTYVYDVDLLSSSQLLVDVVPTAGTNYVKLIGFPDLATAVFAWIAPTGWSASAGISGSDVTVDFDGSSALGGSNIVGPQTLGTLTITTNTLSAAPVIVGLNTLSHDYKSDGSVQVSLTETPVPTAIPLPAAAWAGLGLLGLVGAIRMRKA